MSDSIKLLDAVHDMRATALSVARSIDNIAAILSEVGMDKLSVRLDAAANELVVVSSRLSNAYGDDLSERLNGSTHMAGNLLCLALKAATEKSAVKVEMEDAGQ
ncbi:hypothetical protein HFO71_24285 [Rhizobium laguerreae]|uniref:hypothetical protein n=1 Tax=Rhizobium laguerreae TaxID=1076926 RepID=UPI001C90BE3F|nr:hypothetical protein [Rhizobium laguerreae]MBY3073436.1 hypothetical protein [Rhizobium laguerreae]